MLINNLRNKYNSYQTMIHNFMYMNLLKVLTIIVPLITYPYLVRVLGAEPYGLIIWAWAVVDLFIIFINFGFDISTTKLISINRDNPKEISVILSSTILLKLSFLVTSFFILLLLFSFVESVSAHKELFLMTFLLAVPEAFMPLWYFRGIEKMKYVALITSFIKVFFSILVFIIIKEKNDYILVPLLYAVSGFMSVIFAYYIILVKDKQGFIYPNIKTLSFYIKDSISIFGTNSITVIREKLNILLIERLVGLEAVAFFDLAQKFVNLLITPFHILSSTIYPHMARKKDIKFIKKVILGTLTIILLVYSLQYIFAENIVILLYGKINSSIESIMKILAITVPLGTTSAFVGINVLIIFNKDKELFYSTFITTIIYISLMTFLWFINFNFTLNFFAIIIVITFFIDMLIRLFYAKEFLFIKRIN